MGETSETPAREGRGPGRERRIAPDATASKRAICDDQRNAAGRGPANGLSYPGRVPVVLSVVLGAVLVLVGAALGAVAVTGARGTLRRNRFAGVRTAATLSSEQTFAAANRVAAPLVGAAAVVAIAGGAATLARPDVLLGVILLVVTVLGVLVLAGIGGALGDRAARLVEDEPAPCAGACAGCDLIEGCRPAGIAGS